MFPARGQRPPRGGQGDPVPAARRDVRPRPPLDRRPAPRQRASQHAARPEGRPLPRLRRPRAGQPHRGRRARAPGAAGHPAAWLRPRRLPPHGGAGRGAARSTSPTSTRSSTSTSRWTSSSAGSPVAGCVPAAGGSPPPNPTSTRWAASGATAPRSGAATTPSTPSAGASRSTTRRPAPSRTWFAARGLLVEVDGLGEPGEVFTRILERDAAPSRAQRLRRTGVVAYPAVARW